MSAVGQALAGLKVLEFGGYAAGPHIGKVLANFGARTIHMTNFVLVIEGTRFGEI